MQLSVVDLSEVTHLSWMARLSYDTLYGLPPKSANEGYDELAALAPTNVRMRTARILNCSKLPENAPVQLLESELLRFFPQS